MAPITNLCGLEGCPARHDGGPPIVVLPVPTDLAIHEEFSEFRVCADHRAAIAEVTELQRAVERLTA